MHLPALHSAMLPPEAPMAGGSWTVPSCMKETNGVDGSAALCVRQQRTARRGLRRRDSGAGGKLVPSSHRGALASPMALQISNASTQSRTMQGWRGLSGFGSRGQRTYTYTCTAAFWQGIMLHMILHQAGSSGGPVAQRRRAQTAQ